MMITAPFDGGRDDLVGVPPIALLRVDSHAAEGPGAPWPRTHLTGHPT
jgi:hypothetical protein